MARIPIMGAMTVPDAAGPFFAPISTQITNAQPALELCLVLDCDPATDLGCSGKFAVPSNYSSTPVLIVQGIIDGAVDANLIHCAIELLGRADNEAYDIAFETQDAASFAANGYADEDVFEETVSLTVTLAADEAVQYHFFIDASGGTPFTVNILVPGLYFQYTTT